MEQQVDEFVGEVGWLFGVGGKRERALLRDAVTLHGAELPDPYCAPRLEDEGEGVARLGVWG